MRFLTRPLAVVAALLALLLIVPGVLAGPDAGVVDEGDEGGTPAVREAEFAHSTGHPVQSAPDDDDEIPAWVWAAVGGMAGALILGGVSYRVWLSRRRPPEP
ncbi:MAG: hypothetical protein O7G30_01945 [Proteobacteria bacterium]|nr:hypothetical protein [Pseudomonadota bacterium]